MVWCLQVLHTFISLTSDYGLGGRKFCTFIYHSVCVRRWSLFRRRVEIVSSQIILISGPTKRKVNVLQSTPRLIQNWARSQTQWKSKGKWRKLNFEGGSEITWLSFDKPLTVLLFSLWVNKTKKERFFFLCYNIGDTGLFAQILLLPEWYRRSLLESIKGTFGDNRRCISTIGATSGTSYLCFCQNLP